PRRRGMVWALLGREGDRRARQRHRLHDRGLLGGAAPVPDRLRGHLRAVPHARRRGARPPPSEARMMLQGWTLTWIIFFPLVAAGLIAVMPARAERAIRIWATVVALDEAGFALPLWWQVVPGRPGWQLAEERAWIPAIGASYRLGVDGISAMLVLLTVV